MRPFVANLLISPTTMTATVTTTTTITEGKTLHAARSAEGPATLVPTPTGSDDETQDAGQAEDEFISNIGHKFCILYAPWVRKGQDIFKLKLDDAYDTSERFENDDNKVQGQLHEMVGLLKDQLTQDTILSQKWVRREVRGLLHLFRE
jgi:hypothetical protein